MKIALITVVVLLVLGVAGFFFLGLKSQGGEAPGIVSGQLQPCPSSPNCGSSEEGTADGKKVDPLPITAWAQLPEVVAALGGTVTQQSDAYLAAEFTSSTFRFVDDIEFRLSDDAVHVRSASRVGYSDRGVNHARIAAVRERLEN
ncbi:MAG: DUF1499 domain-containing protein [Pseudomonadota bacterium]